MRRFFLTLFLLAALAVLGLGAAGLWWVHQPLKLPAPSLDLSVEPGTTPRGVAQDVADAGADVQPQLLYLWFRISGQDRQIRAGSYELERGITPKMLLNVLVRGEEATRSLVLVEGWSGLGVHRPRIRANVRVRQDVEAFRVRLHERVLDAVVDHLHEVAGARRAAV